MRIALIDLPDRGDMNSRNRFAGIPPLLAIHGHQTLLFNGAAPRDAADLPPILTGLNRTASAAPMVEANAIAHQLVDHRPDIVIAPLRGGIAQGILMARACGEGFARTRVALWCDTPSGVGFLRDDGLSAGIAPLVADALERQTFAFADALIMPADVEFDSLANLGRRTVPSFRATLPTLQGGTAGLASPAREIAEIVFAGPMTRRGGLPEFIEAMVRLWKRGLMAERTVTFLGPVGSAAQGIGREWLGLRASSWSFPFKVLDPIGHEERQRYLGDPHRLAVAVADDPDQLAAMGRCHIALLRGRTGQLSLLGRLEEALAAALGHSPGAEPLPKPDGADLDWPALVAKLAELPCAGSLPCVALGVTVCILHYNRLEHLAEAIASIPDEVDGQIVEILVLDNASEIPFVAEEIRRVAGPRKSLRVVELETSVPQAAALNRGLLEAQFETILFLDDDNSFAPDGVQRLARAIATGSLDIVVAALDVFDDGVPKPAPSMGRLIFLGAAHSAGLFFNAFGDTAMAVRRDSFKRLGGFQDPGYSYPSLDWVTLAKAQAMGLRIGALQWPAVRYRRDTARAGTVANKLDQEGARSLVFEAYGDNLDGPLLARYAQKLHLDEM